jgi:hypothetical protein
MQGRIGRKGSPFFPGRWYRIAVTMNYLCFFADGGYQALGMLSRNTVQIIGTDMRMSGKFS